MEPMRIFSIISWILLPTVMFGGYSLLHLQVRNTVLTSFKQRNLFPGWPRTCRDIITAVFALLPVPGTTCFNASLPVDRRCRRPRWHFGYFRRVLLAHGSRKTRAWLSRYTGHEHWSGSPCPGGPVPGVSHHGRLNRKSNGGEQWVNKLY